MPGVMRLIMNLHQIKFSGLLLLAVLVALSFIHVAGSFGQGAMRQMGMLKGTVRGYDEKPIAGASITVEPSGGRGAVQSNEAGEFEIPLPAGIYNVLVQKSGYAFSKGLMKLSTISSVLNFRRAKTKPLLPSFENRRMEIPPPRSLLCARSDSH